MTLRVTANKCYALEGGLSLDSFACISERDCRVITNVQVIQTQLIGGMSGYKQKFHQAMAYDLTGLKQQIAN